MSRPKFPYPGLPYGRWITSDGVEILFDRRYVPLLERRGVGDPARLAEPRWVEWVEQAWFYNDANAPGCTRYPRAARETVKRLEEALRRFCAGREVTTLLERPYQSVPEEKLRERLAVKKARVAELLGVKR